MGIENPSRPNFIAKPATAPFAASPQNIMPFSSSGPMGEQEAYGFKPPPVTQQTPFSSSEPVVGPDGSNFRHTSSVPPQTNVPFSWAQ
ncbi:hypothetical protein FF1_032721 [Malus domestica]